MGYLMQGNSPKLVREYLQKQLKALQLKYVDLYLIHHPAGINADEVIKHEGNTVDNTGLKLDMTTDHVALWKEMEKQVDDGLTKAIGLSNFNVKQIERILKVARIPPANLQIEQYLYNQGKAEQELCRKKGITMTSYSTLGSRSVPNGLLSGANLNPLQDPVVCRIAKSHNKSTGQVLLRHVPNSWASLSSLSNPIRIRENFQGGIWISLIFLVPFERKRLRVEKFFRPQGKRERSLAKSLWPEVRDT
ncbi:aldose reductase-related protein 2-like [Homalodisca vitripennis]|uniref:aldose reductase-related protein 2-like n=1 Tax=Homalodisca vitripennis TaxID=197043 RepID=UPI001EE9EA52|nr:aldose reductase-related protein 2-like [Homalodisca vitripennis]